MEIKQVKKGAFVAEVEGKEIGHLDYTYQEKRIIILDSTEVEPDFRHRGIAKKLVMQTVKYARKEDLKIIPVCPYTVAVFKRMKEELADVRA